MSRPMTVLERRHHDEIRIQLAMSDDVLHYLFMRETGCSEHADDYDTRFDDWFDEQYEASK